MANDKTPQSPKMKTADQTPDSTATPGPRIDPKLLSALVCPKTHAPLSYDRETNELISKKAKLAFPIREGVPIMLINEARALS